MMRLSLFVSDTSTDGVKAVNDLLKGDPSDIVKQGNSVDSDEIFIVGREGSVEDLRAWLGVRCNALWMQMSADQEPPGAPAEEHFIAIESEACWRRTGRTKPSQVNRSSCRRAGWTLSSELGRTCWRVCLPNIVWAL